jgi:hypothetical protein
MPTQSPCTRISKGIPEYFLVAAKRDELLVTPALAPLL